MSARAAGIPKPARFNPPVPALIPLSPVSHDGVRIVAFGLRTHFRTAPGDGTR